ncbi:hypothetical protein [Pseudoalteromonas sp. A25]|uniref:hypothetical protein n=1 Tax=Pseudoalteromonas sp. A25 TaxID=116092 RepID=UPI0012607880|nr:hypothetical protein [Pseudoalteromonas sp. A25]
MLVKNMALLGLVIFTSACTLLSDKPSDDKQPVYHDEIEPYISQWEESKQSLERLKVMEEDLSLLIKLVASQADIEALPEQLRSDVEKVTHKVKPQQSSSDIQPKPFIKLRTFLQRELATSYLDKFIRKYPQLNTVLSYQVEHLSNNENDYFVVLAGPFNTHSDAKKVCFVLHQINERCQLLTH